MAKTAKKAKAKAKGTGGALTGSCSCGAVRFSVRGRLTPVFACHCSKCRRWHGHVGAYTSAPVAAVTFAAQKGLTWYDVSKTAQRGFCVKCGSSLFWRNPSEDTLAICPGSLDAPTGLRLAAHMFVGSKGDYYEVGDDGAKQYREFPG